MENLPTESSDIAVPEPRQWAIKIARAKDHIHYLEASIGVYKRDLNPYGIVRHDDPNTGDLTWYAVVTAQPPLKLGAVAGDAIHNLRSSLDILWHRLMFPGGGGKENRSSQFRVYASREDFDKAQRVRAVKSARQAAVDIYRALKPYKTGNDLLWSLVTLDNVDKHRLLIPIVSAIGRFDFGVYPTTPERADANGLPDFLQVIIDNLKPIAWFPMNGVTEVFRLPAAARHRADVQPDITLEVAFGDVGTMHAGKPVLGTLNDFASLVDGIVETFDAASLLR